MREDDVRVLCGFTLSVAVMLGLAGPHSARDTKQNSANKSLSEWVEVLEAKGDDNARRALGPDGPYASAAVPALIDAFKGQMPSSDSAVAEVLADHGAAAVPALLAALKRSEASVRAGAALSLGQIRRRPAEAVPPLIAAINDADVGVRAAAVFAIGRIGKSASGAVPSLTAALADKDEKVRENAAFALYRMGRKSKPALPALILALKDKSYNVHMYAAEAVGKIGPDAALAVPALIETLRTEKDNMRRVDLVQALAGIGPAAKDAVPVIADLLRVKHYLLRPWSASALGDIGPAARDAVPALIAAAKDKGNDNGGRESAMEALGKIGPDAKIAVPMLIEELKAKGENEMAQVAAVFALGGIGPKAKSAVPALAAIVRDESAKTPVRKIAAQAITKIDPELAAKQKLETAWLDVRLGKLPVIQLNPRPAMTAERKNRINALITKLAEIRHPDLGMSGALDGHAFAPLPDQRHVEGGLLTNERLQQSDALRSLVETGPEALPFLLERLNDATPTKLKIENRFRSFGSMGFGAEIEGNPLSLLENRILAEAPLPEEEEEVHDSLRSYTVRVGDVCFVAIGQIVGRRYDAVSYFPTAIISLKSPVESKTLRERVRTLWASKEPARKLLDSLLLDFATEAKSAKGQNEAEAFQAEAAMRLLYYFPKETTPLVAQRLRSDANVRTADFIKAVSWCTAPEIEAALAEVAKQTNDPDVKAILRKMNKKNR